MVINSLSLIIFFFDVNKGPRTELKLQERSYSSRTEWKLKEFVSSQGECQNRHPSSQWISDEWSWDEAVTVLTIKILKLLLTKQTFPIMLTIIWISGCHGWIRFWEIKWFSTNFLWIRFESTIVVYLHPNPHIIWKRWWAFYTIKIFKHLTLVGWMLLHLTIDWF